jgi:hypothetical protein
MALYGLAFLQRQGAGGHSRLSNNGAIRVPLKCKWGEGLLVSVADLWERPRIRAIARTPFSSAEIEARQTDKASSGKLAKLLDAKFNLEEALGS